MPNWIHETNHSISPDGQIAVYQSTLDENRISVSAWFKSKIGSGDGGVFDIETKDSIGLEFSWISASKVLIEYPADSKILRQEFSSYFMGKTISIDYKRKE